MTRPTQPVSLTPIQEPTTAAPTIDVGVQRIQLVDANSGDVLVENIANNAILLKPTVPITFIAIAVGQVDGVTFTVTQPQQPDAHVQMEGVPPFAAFGDVGADLTGVEARLGRYTVDAKPNNGVARSVSFTFVAELPATKKPTSVPRATGQQGNEPSGTSQTGAQETQANGTVVDETNAATRMEHKLAAQLVVAAAAAAAVLCK